MMALPEMEIEETSSKVSKIETKINTVETSLCSSNTTIKQLLHVRPTSNGCPHACQIPSSHQKVPHPLQSLLHPLPE